MEYNQSKSVQYADCDSSYEKVASVGEINRAWQCYMPDLLVVLGVANSFHNMASED